MRYSPVAAAVALTLLTVSTSLHGQRPDNQIDPRSMALLAKGQARASGRQSRRRDRRAGNRARGRSAQPRRLRRAGQGRPGARLPGKAIRLYREALLLEPNDVTALTAQGEAMVAKGAVERARKSRQGQDVVRRRPSAATRPARRGDRQGPADRNRVRRYGRAETGDLEGRSKSLPGRGLKSADLALKARASATNSSTLTVSARRVASIPTRSSAASAPGTAFRL